MAGAWLQEPGAFQSISKGGWYWSEGGFDDQGGALPEGSYQKLETSTYLEYGLNRRWTIGGELRAKSEASEATGGAFTPMAADNAELFARRALLRWRGWNASLQALGGLPLEDGRLASLPRRQGEAELRMAIGRSIGLKGWEGSYLGAEGGYRHRLGALEDQLRIDFALGLRPSRRWLFLAEGFVTEGLGSGPGSYDLTKIQGAMVWRMNRTTSLQIGVTHELAGERIATGNAVFLGLWMRRSSPGPR